MFIATTQWLHIHCTAVHDSEIQEIQQSYSVVTLIVLVVDCASSAEKIQLPPIQGFENPYGALPLGRSMIPRSQGSPLILF